MTEPINGYPVFDNEIVSEPEPEPPKRRTAATMADSPAPGERRRIFARFVRWDLPRDRRRLGGAASTTEERTQLVGGREYVCLECVWENSGPDTWPDAAPAFLSRGMAGVFFML